MATDIANNLLHILEDHRKWIIGDGGARANLARANLAGANLARANLARANLDGANLDGAYLARANLAGANLARANLAGANLDGANLADANLDGAYLAGANLASQYIVDGGQRRDGYRFVGWVKDGVLMIRAGCRNMSVADYRDHNSKRDDANIRDETTSILDHIERVALVRGLIGKSAQ